MQQNACVVVAAAAMESKQQQVDSCLSYGGAQSFIYSNNTTTPFFFFFASPPPLPPTTTTATATTVSNSSTITCFDINEYSGGASSPSSSTPTTARLQKTATEAISCGRNDFDLNMEAAAELEDLFSCSDVVTKTTNKAMRCCTMCGTTNTPLWRSGPNGPKSLCNACGIRMKKSRRRAALLLQEEEQQGGDAEELTVMRGSAEELKAAMAMARNDDKKTGNSSRIRMGAAGARHAQRLGGRKKMRRMEGRMIGEGDGDEEEAAARLLMALSDISHRIESNESN